MKARHKDTGEIIELAEEGIISRDGRRFCWYQVELIPEPIDECKPSLPSNLGEAAIQAAQNDMCDRQIMEDSNERRMLYSRVFRRGFKAGALWMAGQYKTLGETEIYLEDDGGEAPYTQEWLDLATAEFAVPEGFKPGDKVIVQIRKK